MHTSPHFAATALLTLAAVATAQSKPALAPPYAPYAGLHYELRARQSFQIRQLSGRLVHSWRNPVPWVFAELVKPLSFGHVLAMVLDPNGGTPLPKKLVELDWYGTQRWEFDPTPLGRKVHHDFQRLRNGHTMMITSEPKMAPAIHATKRVLDEVLMEVDGLGNVVWEWSSVAHAAQMPITQVGWNSLASGTQPLDVFHANSVQVLPPNRWEAHDPRFKAGNVLLGYREINLVIIIEKSSGDIVWTLHNRTIGQHHARLIPADLPGAGNMLMLDNGGWGGAPRLPYRNHSRVLELNPVTKAIVWDYECRPNNALPWCSGTFFAPSKGSVQRLPNGNTLITSPDAGLVFEVAPDRSPVWQYTQLGWVYRAYRLPSNWPTATLPPWAW